MKIVKRVLERRTQTLLSLNKMHFGFMPGKGTVDAIFTVRRKEEFQKNKKLYTDTCFVGMKKLLIECCEK